MTRILSSALGKLGVQSTVTVVLNHGTPAGYGSEQSRKGGRRGMNCPWTGGPRAAEEQALRKYLSLHVRRRNCVLRSEDA